MSKSPATVAYLDGIRGIAAFLVFIHHFLLVFYSSYYNFEISSSHLNGLEILFGRSVLSVFTNGNFWVHVFFVLSGFVLSRKYFHTNDTETLVSAVHRRFVRLYIPVAFMLILAYLMMKGGAFYNRPVSTIAHSEWWFGQMWTFDQPLERLLNCLYYTTMLQGDSIFNTCLWTLPYEFYGSLFVFAFLVLTHSTRYRKLMMVLMLVYFYLFQGGAYICFVAGIFLCYVEQWVAARKRKVVFLFPFLSMLLGLILGSYPSAVGREGTLFEHLGHTLLEYTIWYHTAGAFLLVLAFVLSPGLQRMCSLRCFRFLGRISFSLYLLHVIVIGSFSAWFFLVLYPLTSYNIAAACVLFATILVVLPIAWLMTRYVDEYGVALAARIYRCMAKRPSISPLNSEISEMRDHRGCQ